MNCQINICPARHIDIGRCHLVDREPGGIRIDRVIGGDFGSGGIQGEMRIVSGHDSSGTVPYVPIACKVSSLDEDKTCGGIESGINGEDSPVSCVGAYLGDVGLGGEEVGDVIIWSTNSVIITDVKN